MIASVFSDPPFDLKLGHEEIHVWCAALDQPLAVIQNLADILSADEKEKAERYHFNKDCKRFIVGRGVLRVLLAYYLEIEPTRLQFGYEPNGKPFVASFLNKENLHFNISHSEGYALYAFTYDRKLGVDIEFVQLFSDMEEIAERFFTTEEKIVLQALSNQEKKTTFYSFWTRKEAFAKAVGNGISNVLDQVDVSQCPGQPILAMGERGRLKSESSWVIQDLKAVPGFASALATEGRNWRLCCWKWSNFLPAFARIFKPQKESFFSSSYRKKHVPIMCKDRTRVQQ